MLEQLDGAILRQLAVIGYEKFSVALAANPELALAATYDELEPPLQEAFIEFLKETVLKASHIVKADTGYVR